MSEWCVLEGDCLAVLQTCPDNYFHSMVTDPPAGVAFMNRSWDSDKGGRDQWIAWLRSVMVEVKRTLKPGAHCLVWALPRTSHWTATALENAGMEIRDICHHLFSTGFPKSQDVGKFIDKIAADLRDVVALKKALIVRFDACGLSRAEIDKACGFRACNYLALPRAGKAFDPWVGILPSPEKWAVIREITGCEDLDGLFDRAERQILGWRRVNPGVAFTSEGPDQLAVTTPESAEAKQWDGWGSALKPAVEHWILCRKPLAEPSIARNVLSHGVGGLNIDGCRVHRASDDVPGWHKSGADGSKGFQGERCPQCDGNCLPDSPGFDGDTNCWKCKGTGLQAGSFAIRPMSPEEIQERCSGGRFPPNLVLSHCPDCGNECASDCPVAELDRQSGGGSRFFPSFRCSEDVDCNASSLHNGSEKGGASVCLDEIVRGDIGESQTAVGTASGENPTVERYTSSLNIAGSGSESTGRSQRDMKSTTEITTPPTTESTISNSSLPSGMTTTISGCERTIAPAESARSVSADDAVSGNPSGTIRSDKQGRTADIVSLAPSPVSASGKQKTARSSTRSVGRCEDRDEIGNRFFPTFRYQAKPSRSEKEAGLNALPDATLNRVNPGGIENDPRWAPVQVKNNHPTVKGIELCRWLCRLITPPGGRVLDPFAGSGSIGCAAVTEGFNYVGIEQDPSYCEIARARIEHWAGKE